jgi:peptidoglycan hydrolase-like protein with peptidoglycan-binding domain
MFNIAGIGKTGADGVDFARFPVPGSNISTTLNQDMLDLFADLGYIVKNGDTTAMLIQFQLDQQIIRSRTDEDAGIYGPKTRTALAALYTQFQSKQASDIISMEKERKLLIGEHDSWQDGYNKAQEQVQTWGQPRLRESGDGVRSLQEWLRDSGHYREPITGQMTPQTLSALRKYQKSKNIKTTGKLDENTR